jgi:transposase
MSDPRPTGGDPSSEGSDENVDRGLPDGLPPKDLPEELLLRRLGRLDTRRALAELCKTVPGLDEILLPRGIQADALTRKSGSSAQMLRGLARKVTQDAAAWGAFRTAIQQQIPPETFEVLQDFSPENLEDLARTHTTEGLLLAALSADEELGEGVVESLIGAWREEQGEAEKRASADARTRDLEVELERLKQENEQLSFASRAAKERAAALAEEVEVLTGEREGASHLVRMAEERAASALDVRDRLDERIAELERRGTQLEQALESERSAYSRAAERVEELHEELGRVVAERDRIQNALQNARFTDRGFGELLVRAVKNEVSALPASIDSTAQTARLLEFMGKVLASHNDLRKPRTAGSTPGPQPAGEDAEESESFLASPPEPAQGTVTSRIEVYARPRPTLSFRALGGAGEVGGSSHLLDFGATRVLVDAGIKPDGRGPVAPNFGKLEGLDAAVITHAHLDHCGALPLLVRDRPEVPIYCTPPSAKLIVSALNDHAAMGGGLAGGAPIHEVK